MSLKFQNKLLQESTIVTGKQQQQNNKLKTPSLFPLPPPPAPHTQRTAQADKQMEKHNIL